MALAESEICSRWLSSSAIIVFACQSMDTKSSGAETRLLLCASMLVSSINKANSPNLPRRSSSNCVMASGRDLSDGFRIRDDDNAAQHCQHTLVQF